MRWILGIDTRNRSQGALRFAAWLRTNMRDTQYEAHGLHIVEHDDVKLLSRHHDHGQVLQRAEASMRRAIEAAGAEQAVDTATVVEAETAEDHLAEAMSLRNADVLVIGRSARREAHSVARLGRVARRLTRLLPGPVLVVPPDLEASHLGDGPVLCAVSPSPESLDAARTATAIAERLGRDAIFIHAVRPPESLWPGGSVPTEAIDAKHQAAELQLQTFCEAHGLEGVRRHVGLGTAQDVVPDRARQLRAPLIVCGSRRLGLAQRVFGSSLGTHLASHSKVPVMIVPPR